MKKSDMKLLFALNRKMVELDRQIQPTDSQEEKDKLEEQYQFALDESCRIADNSEIEEVFTNT